MITINNLNKSFGSKKVLHYINIHFETGKVYGIVGQNGAGKTTLFRCIAGLEGHQGEITSEYPHLKNELGFLETNPTMMSLITGWEYLKILCSAKSIDTENFEEQNIFDLPLNQYANTYSTGMKKKLALMGVLLRKNKVLILDEPFNGVDIQSNMIILDIIQELKKLNKTILISSHIFSTLRDSCDEIILLKNGRVEKRVLPQHFDSLEGEMKEMIKKNTAKSLTLE